MLKYITGLFAGANRSAGPNLKARLALNGMEERDTPAVVGTATITEPVLVGHVSPLDIHAFNPQPDPPARAVLLTPGPC